VSLPRLTESWAGGAAILTLDGVELGEPLLDALHTFIASADLDPEVQCIVIRHEGSALVHDSGDSEGLHGRLTDLAGEAARIPKPVVIELDGVLQGRGIGLVAMADRIVATSTSVLSPGGAGRGLAAMEALLGASRDARLRLFAAVLRGGDLQAVEALDLGLITAVVPRGGVLAARAEFLSGVRLAGPTAVALLKRSAAGGSRTQPSG
jgi:methylglutaconyl-CoA hydratase